MDVIDVTAEDRQNSGGPMVGRSVASGAWRAALVLLLGLATAMALMTWALIYNSHGPFGWLLESFSFVGLFGVGIGVWLWDRRPANRTGVLLVITGITILVAALVNVSDPLLITFGFVFAVTPIAALLHLALGFPVGRVPDRISRLLVVAIYATTILFQIPQYVFSPGPPPISALHISGYDEWAGRSADAQTVVGGLILAVAAVVLVRRWRAAPIVSERRSLGLVYGCGIFTLASFPVSDRIATLAGWSAYTLFGAQQLVILSMIALYGGVILSGGFARTVGLDELAARLGRPDSERAGVRDALASALGDPSLELAFTSSEADVVYQTGPPADVSVLAEGRQAVEVAGPHGPTGTIVYDSHQIPDPELVRAAGQIAALAIDHERLTAELTVSQRALRESRLRILDAGDQERRRLAQDLHDSVQSRLVVAALYAGRFASETDSTDRDAAIMIRDEIDIAITELRHVAHGILPPLLAERGLYAAAEDLVDRMPIATSLETDQEKAALPWSIASNGYFILSEALTNCIKHAQAQLVDVELTVHDRTLRIDVNDNGIGGATMTGTGLQSIADRCEAVGGHFRLRSPTGDGTNVEVRLPCAS